MKRFLAGALILMTFPLTAAAQDTVSNAEYQTAVVNLRETRQRIYALETELSNSHLQQAAMLVNLATQGKSRLLLGAGMSANPQLGKIPMIEGRGGAPYITLYPASEPRAATLDGMGECEIYGAVRMSTGARTSRTNKCEAGSYLLAVKTTPDSAVSLLLLSAKAAANGQVRYQEALQIPAERVRGGSLGSLAFPGANTVSQQHPAWQVKIEIPGKEQHIRAYLNMDITML